MWILCLCTNLVQEERCNQLAELQEAKHSITPEQAFSEKFCQAAGEEVGVGQVWIVVQMIVLIGGSKLPAHWLSSQLEVVLEKGYLKKGIYINTMMMNVGMLKKYSSKHLNKTS